MILKLLSVAVMVWILFGFTQRFRPRVHIPVMVSAFVMDMSMVLYIELNRAAVKTAMGPTSFLMKVHLFFAFGTVLLYVVQIVSGAIRFKKGGVKFHKYTGISFLLFRSGNLVTSFLIPTTG